MNEDTAVSPALFDELNGSGEMAHQIGVGHIEHIEYFVCKVLRR